MAEATSTKTKRATVETREGETGSIEYVDMGDWTLEIDRRLENEVRRRIPKSQRMVALDDERDRELLEERIKIQNEVAKQERDEEVAELELPPEREKKSRTDEPESFTVTAEGESKGGKTTSDTDTP